MKRFSLLLLIFISMGVYANEQDYSLRVAKHFCVANQECIDALSLEIDSAYESGLRDGKSGNSNNLIVAKRRKLSNFCIGAPDNEFCSSYRDVLLQNYIKGLSQK